MQLGLRSANLSSETVSEVFRSVMRVGVSGLDDLLQFKNRSYVLIYSTIYVLTSASCGMNIYTQN